MRICFQRRHIMAFPQTRLTLVQRLAVDGDADDWAQFLKDYWGPVCRFALRFGARNLDDAEDVASQTFEALWENRLLVRWVSNRSAKLRTLLCRVVRNILSNRNRVQANRRRLADDLAAHLRKSEQAADPHADAFYAAWVEDVIQRAVEALATDYYAAGKGDYIRVLYGRLCQQQTIAQVADALQIKPSAVDNYFRHARKRLTEKLQELVRRQVQNYCDTEQVEQEFTLEWGRMGSHLEDSGGLEQAVRRAYDLLDPVAMKEHRGIRLTRAITRLTSIVRSPNDASPSADKR